jgi:cation:H+ antiporter
MIQVPPAIEFLGGLVVLIFGAEVLIRNATAAARMLGISPIVVGLTIVSVGTSTPELAVGLTAVAEGNAGLAVGNIAGTNTVNILLILGSSAAIRALPIRMQSIKLDVPAMIGAAVALIIMSLDGVLTRGEGALLLLAAVLYTALLVRESRRESLAVRREFARELGGSSVRFQKHHARFALHAALLIAGVALTVLGAELLVAGAVNLARGLGVSDAFIGLTIVAIGTSAPELATTLVATLKGDRDVAIGNLIGSCTYNILAILGLTMLAAPGGVEVARDLLWIDLPLAAISAAVCLPVFKSGAEVSRREGTIFVAAYLVYLTALVTLRT